MDNLRGTYDPLRAISSILTGSRLRPTGLGPIHNLLCPIRAPTPSHHPPDLRSAVVCLHLPLSTRLPTLSSRRHSPRPRIVIKPRLLDNCPSGPCRLAVIESAGHVTSSNHVLDQLHGTHDNVGRSRRSRHLDLQSRFRAESGGLWMVDGLPRRPRTRGRESRSNEREAADGRCEKIRCWVWQSKSSRILRSKRNGIITIQVRRLMTCRLSRCQKRRGTDPSFWIAIKYQAFESMLDIFKLQTPDTIAMGRS